MTRSDQRRFVREISRRIANDICQAITEQRVPREWNGHEFRALLADKHAESASMSLLRKEPHSVAAKNYRRTVAENNLI